jgi:Domain of unknown function (DUF1844)
MADPNNYPVPPANFLFLVQSILMQAQMQLGLLNFGDKEEEMQPDLQLARHSIDLLAMLEEKTKGNLTIEEQRMLENGLTELRFRYVQVSDELKQKNEPKPQVSTEGEKKEDDKPLIITADGGKGTKTA